jgi:hypothetical protein
MDFVKNFTSGDSTTQGSTATNHGDAQGNQQKKEGGIFSGLGDKLNSAAGGGRESEKNEDMLDKGSPLISHSPLIWSYVLCFRVQKG